MEVTPRKYIICGTMAGPTAAFVYYNRLAASFGAQIVLLAGLGFTHIDHTIEKIKNLVKDNELPVDLVGHSQGGLAAILFASYYPEMVHKAVSIAAPLSGTKISIPTPGIGVTQCLAPSAKILADIRPSENMAAIVALRDKVIIPVSSAAIAEPGKTYYVDAGHISIARDFNCIQIIKNFLYFTDSDRETAKK